MANEIGGMTAEQLLQEARAQRDWLIKCCADIGVTVNVSIGAPIAQAYQLVNEKAAQLEGELSLSIKQTDSWIANANREQELRKEAEAELARLAPQPAPEPRCPKCGSGEIKLTGRACAFEDGVQIGVRCPKCDFKSIPKSLADFAKFSLPAPNPQRAGLRCDICKQEDIPEQHVTIVCHKPECEEVMYSDRLPVAAAVPGGVDVELIESLEEAAVLLAEIEVRFGKVKVLDENCDKETDESFGDYARLYNHIAQKARKHLSAGLEVKG